MVAASPAGGRPATLEYLDSDFVLVEPGDHVVCAVTGARILLEDLRYWSVGRQEAYKDAAAALVAYDKARTNGDAF